MGGKGCFSLPGAAAVIYPCLGFCFQIFFFKHTNTSKMVK
jgi:hypothetical protein